MTTIGLACSVSESMFELGDVSPIQRISTGDKSIAPVPKILVVKVGFDPGPNFIALPYIDGWQIVGGAFSGSSKDIHPTPAKLRTRA